MLDFITDFLKEIEVEHQRYYSIKNDSKIKIGGHATAASPDTEDKLVRTVRFLSKSGIRFKVVGAMSNILPCDCDYDGVIVRTSNIDTYNAAENNVSASCGCFMPALFRRLAAFGIGGFSELASIPGSIGGAVYGNAGAFGKSISDVIISAEIYDYARDELLTLTVDELEFSYRDSALKHRPWILLNASFVKSETSSDVALAQIRAFAQKRKSTQPNEPSLGSVFKRVDSIAVSKLIDEAGLKGVRVGDAEVSVKHAGFIVNLGNATSEDVKALIGIVKERIFQLYGLKLEEEIELL